MFATNRNMIDDSISGIFAIQHQGDLYKLNHVTLLMETFTGSPFCGVTASVIMTEGVQPNLAGSVFLPSSPGSCPLLLSTWHQPPDLLCSYMSTPSLLPSQDPHALVDPSPGDVLPSDIPLAPPGGLCCDQFPKQLTKKSSIPPIWTLPFPCFSFSVTI